MGLKESELLSTVIVALLIYGKMIPIIFTMSDVHKVSREVNTHPTIRTVTLHSTVELVGQYALIQENSHWVDNNQWNF